VRGPGFDPIPALKKKREKKKNQEIELPYDLDITLIGYVSKGSYHIKEMPGLMGLLQCYLHVEPTKVSIHVQLKK
jgi:hypothetical protein